MSFWSSVMSEFRADANVLSGRHIFHILDFELASYLVQA